MSLEKLVSEARKSDEVVKLARELLRINSESETAQIQNFVKDFLKSVGAKVETHSVNGKTFAVTSVTGENKKTRAYTLRPFRRRSIGRHKKMELSAL